MSIETTFLISQSASQLESNLLEMNLFLYHDKNWTEWWTKNLGREIIVLKHHDYAFSERAENRVISTFVNPLENVSELKEKYHQEVNQTHRLKDVEIKLEALALVNGNIRSQNKTNNQELYYLQKALEEYVTPSISEVFAGEDLSAMTLSIPSSEWRSLSPLKKDLVIQQYAKTVVQELRNHQVPFFAFYSQDGLLEKVIAENNPQEEKYVWMKENIPLMHLTKKAMFKP